MICLLFTIGSKIGFDQYLIQLGLSLAVSLVVYLVVKLTFLLVSN